MKTLRKLLFPLAPLYAFAVWLRNYLFDIGWIKSFTPQTPVLCVGNLSVGGTGKTPMVEWLIAYFEKRKRNVAVLSRGYGRKSSGFIEVRYNHEAAVAGDEPLQLKRKHPETHIAVDANRKRGIQILERTVQPEVIILDDGFQHRKVKANYNLLLTSSDRLYTDQTYLPSGDLRDHINQSKRADLIIVTKFPENPDAQTRSEVLKKLRPLDHQKVVFATLSYDNPKDTEGIEVGWENLVNQEFTLVTGIANPDSLMRFLDNTKIRYRHLAFPDHHRFTEGDFLKIKGCGQVLTTEKDAVRLEGRLSNFYVIGVSHHFEPEDFAILQDFLEKI
jgi:tetraacyldisaccharide 4'-kinase